MSTGLRVDLDLLFSNVRPSVVLGLVELHPRGFTSHLLLGLHHSITIQPTLLRNAPLLRLHSARRRAHLLLRHHFTIHRSTSQRNESIDVTSSHQRHKQQTDVRTASIILMLAFLYCIAWTPCPLPSLRQLLRTRRIHWWRHNGKRIGWWKWQWHWRHWWQ